MKRKLMMAALALALTTGAARPAGAAVSFLEAALYFLTAVEPTQEDTITENEIALHQYPLAVSLVENESCMVRIRHTINKSIWQLDFCKITKYQWSSTPQIWVWLGQPGVFCSGALLPNADYFETDLTKIATKIKCDLGVGTWGQAVAFQSNWDARMFTTGKINYPREERSTERLMQSFKYIEMLLTPTEQRKPY